MDAVVRPFGENHTEVVHADIGGKGPTTHKERGSMKEMKGWRVKEKHTPSSSSDGDDDQEQSSNE